jgi:hypothetical protein
MSIETKDVVNLLKRRPLISACVGVSLGLLALLYLRMDLIPSTTVTLEDRNRALAKLKTNIKNSVQLAEQTEALAAVNKVILDNAFREGELALNQQLFLRLETELGVRLIDLRALPVPAPAKGAAAKGYVPMGFSLSVGGDYQQLITYLKRLESAPTLARLVSASITGPNPNSQTINMNIEMLGLRR